MQQYKKIFVIIVASLGIALGLGLIAGKIYIGKILKKPETRKEIESIIESALTELLSRPRVFIGAASLKGFSTFVVSNVKVYEGKALLFSAPTSAFQCSLIGQALLGSCDAELQSSLGLDGDITFNMKVPRSLFFAGDDYHYDLKGTGSLSAFNLFKLLDAKSSDTPAPLKLRSAVVDGTYTVGLLGKGQPRLVIDFDGRLAKAQLEINVRGKRQEKLSLPALAFRIEQEKLSFTKPVEVSVLGATLVYSGGLGFVPQLSWEGALKISSAGMFSAMIPKLFNCKSKPTNPLSFKLVGLVGAPMCR